MKFLLIVTVFLAGCVTLTPEQQAAQDAHTLAVIGALQGANSMIQQQQPRYRPPVICHRLGQNIICQ